MRARWVIAASGCLSHPKKADIQGLDNFKGKVLYTYNWPRDPKEAEAAIKGKFVGIIGTGSSAVQVSDVISCGGAA